MRNEPVLPSDLTWLTKPMTLFELYGQSANILHLFIGGLSGLSTDCREKYFKGRIISSWKIQIGAIAVMLLCFKSVNGIFSDKENGKIKDNVPIISTLNNYQDINWLGNTTNARYKGLSYVWMNQLTTEVVPKPDGYSKERLEKISQKYTNLSNAINKEK